MARPIRVEVYCTRCPWEGDRAKWACSKLRCPKCGAVVVKRQGSEFDPNIEDAMCRVMIENGCTPAMAEAARRSSHLNVNYPAQRQRR